ncbi:hypothetical protein ABZX62_09665 [Streptomyces flavidovirens]|uniref:Uncharacterized protein n=1 Tax=Streptomyces flavidovirens TaxID=67298 RepID=A0ABW6RKF8_9ACTN
MSIVVKFFAAPDDTSAALALPTGPGRAFESLSFGSFDPEEAVVEWECLLAGCRFEELVEAGEPRIVAGQDDDGCVSRNALGRVCGQPPTAVGGSGRRP